MPAKSKAQFKFMKMMEHNPELAKQKKIDPEVAKEFTKENVGKKSYDKLPKEARFKKLFKK